MATTFYFNNKKITLPGVYSVIKAGNDFSYRALDYGKVLIIDTGQYDAHAEDELSCGGGGVGIANTSNGGEQAIYSFTSLADFQAFVGGGIWYKLAEPLFNPDPNNPAAEGVSEIYYVRAATTTPSTLVLRATPASGTETTFTIKTLNEGYNSVGKLDENNNIYKGFGYTITAGVENPDAFIMNFYKGTYTGEAKDGLPYNEVYKEDTTPILLCSSPEFTTFQELYNWCITDSNFGMYFAYQAPSTGVDPVPTSTGVLSGLRTVNPVLATGGTTSYIDTASEFKTSVLDYFTESDYSAVMTDIVVAGTTLSTTLLQTIIEHINTDSIYQRFLYVATGTKQGDFENAITLSTAINNDLVQTVFGDAGKASQIAASGYRWWGSLYMTASVLGRTFGKPPYIPVTNKSIGIDMLGYSPTTTQKEKALKKGLNLVVNNPSLGRFVVLQGINTLQDNTSLFNTKGQSFSTQFMRIVAQINKELVVNANMDLLSQENGVNVMSLSANFLKEWTINYLNSRVATPASDNLILSFQDVSVTRQEDAYFVSYYIRVNNEITKLFFTGFLLK